MLSGTVMLGKSGPSSASHGEGREKILLFTVADELMGIGIAVVKEVIDAGGLRPIEAAGDGACGEILYRRRSIPVVRLASFFDYPSLLSSGSGQVLVVGVDGVTLGLLVDSVQGIVEVTPREIEPMPAMLSALERDYFRGFLNRGDRIIILLDGSGFARMKEISRPTGETEEQKE